VAALWASCTCVPASKMPVHVPEEHVRPAGVDVIVPVPLPAISTVSVYVWLPAGTHSPYVSQTIAGSLQSASTLHIGTTQLPSMLQTWSESHDVMELKPYCRH
jgi:hypothetical protein